MDEKEMHKDVYKAKKWNFIIIGFFAAIFLFALVGLGIYTYQHTFTVEKWFEAPNDRIKIVDDLIKRYKLIGKTEQEIISLLGEEEEYANTKTSFKMSQEYFEPESTIIYYLGVRYVDDMWLILILENGIVVDYRIDVT